jgi:hypothetical protein
MKPRRSQKSKLFHCSPSQQIEYWAGIGRILEPVLNGGQLEKIGSEPTRLDLDKIMAEVESPEGIARTQEVIRKTSGFISAVDAP